MTTVLYVFALTATLAVFAGAGKPEYCNISSCRGKGRHTLCVYNFLEVSSRCGKVDSVGLSEAEKNTIIQVHNRLRARVAKGEERRGINGPQPAATNVGPLQWDQEIADIAQTWVDQCIYKHDDCRDSQRFQVGQNILQGDSSATVQSMVERWYNEVELYDRSHLQYFDPPLEEFKATGHYTQFVWAETTLVGCGLIRYSGLSYLACNYGPSGNVRTQEVYKSR